MGAGGRALRLSADVVAASHTVGCAYSNSTRIWFTFTPSPWATLIFLILPATGAVMLVSIFIASSTIIRSFVCSVWPGWALSLTTTPATGLRQTFDSSTFSSTGGASAPGPGTVTGCTVVG